MKITIPAIPEQNFEINFPFYYRHVLDHCVIHGKMHLYLGKYMLNTITIYDEDHKVEIEIHSVNINDMITWITNPIYKSDELRYKEAIEAMRIEVARICENI